MLLPKPLDQIAAADIRSLVENKVNEASLDLEDRR
jgi:hypothetical protein